MKIERLKKNGVWKWIGVTVAISLIVFVVTFKGTKAKYRYTASFPAVKGTVHYKSGDLEVLAVNIQNDAGEYISSDTIPTSGYVLNAEQSYCGLSNGDGTYTHESTTITYANGKITIGDLTKKGTKCFLYFDIKLTASEALLAKYNNGSTELVSDGTIDNNIRYIGANPNNYVYFNCDDYFNPSASTCEKWRIIGVMNNVTTGSGTKESLIKLIRADSLGNIMWDYKYEGVGSSVSSAGSNDWTDSQVMMMLNPSKYYKNTLRISGEYVYSGSYKIFRKPGSYYNGTSGYKPAQATPSGLTEEAIDFRNTGLKNDTTRNMIEEVVWNLGGVSSGTPSQYYGYERGTTVPSGRQATWKGKIGLMYPSDYGYATAGGSTTNRDACLSAVLYNWSGSGVSDCKNNDWLYNNSSGQLTLTPDPITNYLVFQVSANGIVGNGGAGNAGWVRPTLYLKSSVTISGGEGSSSSPYILSM